MRNLLKFFYKMLCLVRVLLVPFIFLLSLLGRWAKDRLAFEDRNLLAKSSESYKLKNIKAEIAFEISSEGELEQIYPILENFLESDRLVEIIYSSESVERSIARLVLQYGERLRILRLPILSYGKRGRSLSNWITAETFVLCRYDFYPELMLFGMRENIRFVLASATLKGKKLGIVKRFMLRGVYNLFDQIIAASLNDKNRFIELGISPKKLLNFDFRTLRINKRVKKSNDKLSILEFYKPFFKLFSLYEEENRLILGSAWPNEMEIFQDDFFLEQIRSEKLLVAIAPHKLNNLFVSEIEQKFLKVTKGEMPIYKIEKNCTHKDISDVLERFKKNRGPIIVLIPGILCEMYSIFQNVFVGGGHGRSIHSVLEPYVAFSRIFCGPKTYRSTEYDYITENSENQIHVVNELSEFAKIYFKYSGDAIDFEKRDTLFKSLQDDFLKVLAVIDR